MTPAIAAAIARIRAQFGLDAPRPVPVEPAPMIIPLAVDHDTRHRQRAAITATSWVPWEDHPVLEVAMPVVYLDNDGSGRVDWDG